MSRRKSIPMGESKRVFSKTAKFVHPKNGLGLSYGPTVRGGIRF